MSMAISDEEYDMGIQMMHDRVRDAIKAYEDFLITYGTVPDMTLAENLKALADKMLTHDREFCDTKSVDAFRYPSEVQDA